MFVYLQFQSQRIHKQLRTRLDQNTGASVTFFEKKVKQNLVNTFHKVSAL